MNPAAPATATDAAPDVFISYAREDRPRAEAVAAALEAQTLSVWWDRQITGGQDFADVIGAQLAAARVVLVLWSAASVRSGFVRDEASRARDSGKLLPVRIDEVQLPLGFGSIHTLDLLGWAGDTDAQPWTELLAAVQAARRRGPGMPEPAAAPRTAAARGGGWQRPLVVALALAGGGGLAWNAWRGHQQAQQTEARQSEAQQQFQQGLAAHFARDANLVAARNAYLSALRLDPALGRAHYYLAQVYALQSLRADALPALRRDAKLQFSEALRLASDLDAEQADDARRQLAALEQADAGAPVVRAAVPAPVPAPAPEVGGGGGLGDLNELLKKNPPGAGAAARPKMAPMPLPVEAQADIDSRVALLFSPSAQARASAATSLALNPEWVSDALPVAIERSLRGLREEPGSEAVAAGVAATLQLMQGASLATLKAHQDAAARLLDAAASLGENTRATAAALRGRLAQARQAPAPVAYLQIANPAQMPVAQALAERLRAAGYVVPAVEDLSRKPGAGIPKRSEVRVQGASDQSMARWLQKVTGQAVDAPVNLSTLRGAKPAADTFEIWFDAALCAEGGRRVGACAP